MPIIRLALSDKIVPKKTKSETNNGADAAAPVKEARSAKVPSARKKPLAKRASAVTGRKPKSVSAVNAVPFEPTDEEIRLRAYFIAERRHRLDLPGDADSDWLEAKRQLVFERAPK